MSRVAYIVGVRDPSLGRQVTAMVQAMDAGVSAELDALPGTLDPAPAFP